MGESRKSLIVGGTKNGGTPMANELLREAFSEIFADFILSGSWGLAGV